ncbi:hypothetical protein LMG30113_07522 [Burkholderia paludis]|nr:hypothetical protein LMG30113_07522 [Burkholderia paludis]
MRAAASVGGTGMIPIRSMPMFTQSIASVDGLSCNAFKSSATLTRAMTLPTTGSPCATLFSRSSVTAPPLICCSH